MLRYQIDYIVLLPFDVFPDAYVDTLIFILRKKVSGTRHLVKTLVFGKRDRIGNIGIEDSLYNEVSQHEWENTEGHKFVLNPQIVSLLHRLKSTSGRTFKDVVNLRRGVLFEKSLLTAAKTAENSYPYFEGDVYRYEINEAIPHWVEFGDKMKERPKAFIWFTGPRILVRRLVNRRQRIMAASSENTFITDKNLYTVLPKEQSLNLHLMLGVLNSKLISSIYIEQVTQAVKDDFPQVTIKDLYGLPFPAQDAIDKYGRSVVSKVEEMLTLQGRLAIIRRTSSNEQTDLLREIARVDQQIDNLVYDLYGLTAAERQLVEGQP